MFGRRNRPSLAQRARSLIWPTRGFARSWRYVVARMARLKTSPHAIAAGFAAGAAVSFTPLLGLHFVLAFALCLVTRGSFVAAVAGTVVGNPLTFPFIFAATYWLGTLLRALVATPPEDALEVVAEGFDAESEARAEAAADAVLDTAESLLEDGWSFAALEVLLPTLSTMLIGAAPLALLAYVGFYALVRAAVTTFQAARRRRAPKG